MTLLTFDGFDVADFANKWIFATGSPDSSATTPFGYGRSLHFDDADYGSYAKKAFTASATVFVGTQFRWDAGLESFGFFGLISLYGDNGATKHLELQLDDDGTLRLLSGATTLDTSPMATIMPGTFCYIEIGATVDDSAGSVEVRVNTNPVLSFSGDTKNGGTSTDLDALALHIVGFGDACPDCYYDDTYVCNALNDGIGPANDDFLGVKRVQSLLPNAAGTDTDLTPTPGAPNYGNVNDVPWSSADYNFSGTIGDRDTYGLDNLISGTADIAGVQTVVIVQSTDTTAKIKPVLRSGGTLYYDPEYTLAATTPVEPVAVIREVDPDTGSAWTVASVNALEAGVEVTG